MGKSRAAASTALGVTVATLGIACPSGAGAAARPAAPAPRPQQRAAAGATLQSIGFRFVARPRREERSTADVQPLSATACAPLAIEDCFTVTGHGDFVSSMSVEGYYSTFARRERVCEVAIFSSGQLLTGTKTIRSHEVGCAYTTAGSQGSWYTFAMSNWVTNRDFANDTIMCGRFKFTVQSGNKSVVETTKNCVLVHT